MGILTHLPTLLCQDIGPDGRPCVEAHGHVALGLTHMDALGYEWLPEDLNAGYVPTNPPREMAQAS